MIKTTVGCGFLAALCVSVLALSPHLQGQAPGVKVYSQSQLLQMVQEMRDHEDKAKGVASKPLENYPTRHTILATRDKDGQAELHEKVSDFFVVVEGEATLVTGGTIVDPTPSKGGEVLGASVRDGQKTRLGKGDVVQIPPNIPHQLLVPAGKTFTYFVIKFQEQP